MCPYSIAYVDHFTIFRRIHINIFNGSLNGCCLPSEVQYLCMFSATKAVTSDVLDQSSGLMPPGGGGAPI